MEKGKGDDIYADDTRKKEREDDSHAHQLVQSGEDQAQRECRIRIVTVHTASRYLAVWMRKNMKQG